MFGFYGNGIALTEKMLDFLWGRQTVTLNNIANDDTPGFKSQYISFENILGEKLKDASAGWRPMRQVEQAINSTRASLHTTRAESTRLDGNNVDMDQEQVDLARTALEYQYMVSSIGNDISRLQSAVRSF
ncbi:flagellar basal body rod protein FlgB [Clostridiaceae bacterium]|jgi:flagellar basal-body rod protein FlgB|nr:flagellar basal body rod protein FlgB [Clostridium sp.]NBI69912.1 flagellar basal body rod protein FlgB [Clostridiaceae bacterium]